MSRAARLITLGVGLALLATGFGMCARVAERGRYAAAYSSLGAGPDGTRGLFLVAEGLGASPIRFTRDLTTLPPGGTLLALGGCSLEAHRPVRRLESEALESWVDRGGVLIVAGATDYLPDSLGVSLERPAGHCGGGLVSKYLERITDEEPAGDTPEVVDFPADEAPEEGEEPPLRWAEPVAPMLSGLPELPMDRPARVVVADGTPHEVLLEIAGEPAGVLVPRGRGAVVALSSATPFENEWLSEGLGGVFFFRLRDALAPSGSVLFDEYHLGVGASRSLVQYLRSLGAGPVFAQLGFAIALLLFRLGARLGRPVEPSPPRAEGSDTFVEAVGGLYERSGDRAAVVEVLRRRALARIARHHRVDSADAGVLAKSVAGRVSEPTERAISALGGSAASISSDRAMIERAREIDALTAAATSEPKRPERTRK